MKKFIAIMLSLVLCCCFSVSAFASEGNGQETDELITFNDESISYENDYEKGAERLEMSGHTDRFVTNMSDDNLQIIANAAYAKQSISYYTEHYNADEDTRFLEPVTKNEFLAHNHSVETLPENFVNKVMPEYENSGIATLDVTENVDDGQLVVMTTFFAVEDGAYSQYIVVAEFVWTVMPDYRGTDYFAITRDEGTTEVPGSFDAYTGYVTYRYLHTATSTNVITTLYSTEETVNTDYSNHDSSNHGYGIEFSLPSDISAPSSLVAGTSSMSSRHVGLCGGVAYSGTLKYPTLPQYLNHWSTYVHQTGWYWLGSLSITYPFGASLQLDGRTGKYASPVVDTILISWGM